MNKSIVLLSLILTGCVASFNTYQKPNQDFSDYSTWCWLKGCEVVYQGPDHYYDQKTLEEITNVIAQKMYEKGYTQSDDSSDLAVNYFIILEEDSTTISDEYDDIVTSSFYPQYEKFLKGSLVIDIIDRQQSELIWRSSAEKYLDINPSYDPVMINKVITRAMKKFPERSN